MSNARRKTVFFTLAAIPLLAIAGFLIATGLAGGSAGGTLASGRGVMTHSDSFSLSSTFSHDTATIKTSGMNIVVAPSKLIVDGTTVAEIDHGTADVQVYVKDGHVTFVADGQPVPTTQQR